MANHYDRKSIQELASIVNAGKAAETQNLEAGRKKAAQNKVLQENGLYYKQVDSPYGKLNDEVLKSVADKWMTDVYYDLADPEDVQRKNSGILPKYYDDKYDLDDPYDSWLYKNNLPYKAKFNSIYDDKYDAWATDYNKRVDEVNKKLDEERLINSLKTDAANALIADPESDRQKIVHDLLTTEKYQPLIDMYYQIIEDEDDPYGYTNIKNFGKEVDETKLTNNDIFSLYEEVMGNDYGVTAENLAKIQKLENEAAEYRKKAASATGRRKQNFERSAAMAEEQAEKLKADGVKYVETEAVTEQPATPQRTGVFGNYFNERNAAAQNKEQLAAQAVAERDGESVAKKRMELIEKRSQLKQAGISPWERARLKADIKTLEDEIAIAEKGAEQVEKYEKLRSNDDFAEKSKVDASIKNDGSREWSTYAYINNLTGQNTEANMAEDYDSYFDYVMGVYGTMDPMAQREQDALRATEYLWNPNNVLNRMTDDEKALYNYIASTQGIVAAQEYVDSLANTELYGREIAANEATGEQLGESGFMGSIASALLSPMGALESAYAVNDVAKGASPKEIQSNFRQTEYASGSREAITQRIVENTNRPLGFLYGTAMSMAETLMRMPMGKLGLVLAGGSAMAQTMNDALKEGHDVKQALMLGSIAGGIEAITENIGLDNIFKILNGNPIAASGKEFAKIMLAQGGTEAMEEGIANIGNLIADVLINGDENDIKRSVAAYMMEGMSESQAAGRVVADKLLDLLSDTAGGFISGLLFGAGGQAVALTRVGGMDAVAEYRTTLAEAGAVIAPETRVAMLDDMKELGISEEDSEAYIKVFDSYGEIPATWATPESVEVVQETTKAIHEAAENARQLNATNKTKVTQSEQRLTSLYTAMNQAIEALKAIDPTDLRSYTKAMQTVNKAVSAYKAAIPVEQAKVNEANTKTEVSKGREQEKVAAAMAVAQQALSADYQAVSERIRAIQDADALKAEADAIKAEAAAKGDTRTQSIVDMMLEDMADPIPVDMTIDGVNALIAEAQASGDMAAVEKYSNWLGRIQAQEAIQQNNVDLFDELFGGENGRQDLVRTGLSEGEGIQSEADNRPEDKGGNGENPQDNGSPNGDSESTGQVQKTDQAGGIRNWTEDDSQHITKAVNAWNDKLASDGSEIRISDDDIRPAQNVDTETEKHMQRLRSVTGSEFFLYESDNQYAPDGFTDGKNLFVRLRDNARIVFTAAHEYFHTDRKLQKAAKKIFDEMDSEILEGLFKARGENLERHFGKGYKESMLKSKILEEIGADIYGEYLYGALTDNQSHSIPGLDDVTFSKFCDAFAEFTNAEHIEELKEVEEASTNLSAFGAADDNITQDIDGDNIDFSSTSPDTGKKAPLTQAQRELKKAMVLYEQGVTVAEYAEREDMKPPIMNKLRGLYLKNGNAQGGMLPEEQLKDLMRNAKQGIKLGSVKLSLKFPIRVFEALGMGKEGKTLKERAENFVDARRTREAYYGFIQSQASNAETYKNESSKPIREAFKGGKKQEAILAQMIGEKILNNESAKKARFDGEHFIVPVNGGAYVFDDKGNLMHMVDSEVIISFDRQSVIDRIKSGKKATPAQITPIKSSKVSVKGNDITVEVEGNVIAKVVNGKQANVEIADNTANALIKFYADALKLQNKTLAENGYRPIPKRKNYFPHQGAEATGIDAFIGVLNGDAEALPAAIAGITETFTPGKPWARHALERTGPFTEFDAIRGFNTYVRAAADVIFITPAIQRVRQLERYLRSLAEHDENVDPNANAAVVTWLHDFGNTLANKKSALDRSAENMAGRGLYTVSDTLTRFFGAASVAGSISSALSNEISFLNALPSIHDKKLIPKAMGETIRNGIARIKKGEDDGFSEKIPFLNRRFNAYEPILMRSIDKAKNLGNKVLGLMFAATDRITTESAARAKYEELMLRGMTEEQAIAETDAWCMKVFTDRSKGNVPRLFNSKLLKPLTQFQLEVTNQLSHFKDMKQQNFGEALGKVLRDKEFDKVDWDSPEIKREFEKGNIKNLGDKVLYLILMSLWGELTRWMMGRDQTWNPYGMAKDFVNDFKDDGFVEAVMGLGENVVEQLPLASVITGGGRIPLMGGWDKIVEAWETWHNEDATLEDKWMDTFRAATSFIPGGGQLRKTVEGARANKKGGYYTDSGSLKYPITEDEYWKTLLFGTSAAMPEDYDWSEYVTGSRLESYNEMVDNGIDPDTAFDIMSGYGSNTIADKAIAIANNDDDLSDEEVDIIAEIMGLKPSGDFDEWVVGQVEKRMADLDKQLEKEKIEQKEYDKQMSAYEIFIEMMMED